MHPVIQLLDKQCFLNNHVPVLVVQKIVKFFFFFLPLISHSNEIVLAHLTLTPCALFSAQQDHLGVLNYVIDCLNFMHI